MGDPISFRKGTIISYDQNTGDNVVRVGDTDVLDLPILGVAEAATYTPGASVGILVADSGGSQSWFIIGRIVRPNTSDYSDAVNRLSNSFYSDQVATSSDTTSTSFGDLPTYGPLVTPTVKSSGKLLVMVGCVIIADDTDLANGGLMSVEIRDPTGAIVWGAGSLPNTGFYYSDNATHAIGDAFEATRAFLVSGLSTGIHTVTAKYRSQGSGTSLTTFTNRNVTCVAL
jgi:hypothetical protein